MRAAGLAAYGKKIGDVVAEGAIVGVLLDSHDLQRIVAQAADARQHLLGKGHVGVDLRSRHPSSACWEIHRHCAQQRQSFEQPSAHADCIA